MKDEKFMTCLGAILTIVIVAFVGAIANGWALSTIWNWFIPPVFGLTSLTFFQALGVAIVFDLFTGTKSRGDSEKHDDLTSAIISALAKSIALPIMNVLIAWVVLQFAF